MRNKRTKKYKQPKIKIRVRDGKSLNLFLKIILLIMVFALLLSSLRNCFFLGKNPRFNIDLGDGIFADILKGIADLIPGGLIGINDKDKPNNPGDSDDPDKPGDSGDSDDPDKPGDSGDSGDSDNPGENSEKCPDCEVTLDVIHSEGATCVSTGLRAHRKCPECDQLYTLTGVSVVSPEDTIIPIDPENGHSYNELRSYNDGTHFWVCEYALNHLKEENCFKDGFGLEQWLYDAGQHYHECECGYLQDEEEHIDEDEDSLCDVCACELISTEGGENPDKPDFPEIPEIPENPNIPEEPDDTTSKCICGGDLVKELYKSPTCISEGIRAHRSCSACPKLYDFTTFVEITDTVIPRDTVNGHLYNITTSNNDGTHTLVCGYNASHTKTEDCIHNGSLDVWEKNTSYHWHECKCGYAMNVMAHSDVDEDMICDVCAIVLFEDPNIRDAWTDPMFEDDGNNDSVYVDSFYDEDIGAQVGYWDTDVGYLPSNSYSMTMDDGCKITLDRESGDFPLKVNFNGNNMYAIRLVFKGWVPSAEYISVISTETLEDFEGVTIYIPKYDDGDLPEGDFQYDMLTDDSNSVWILFDKYASYDLTKITVVIDGMNIENIGRLHVYTSKYE